GFLYTANFLSNDVTEVFPKVKKSRDVLSLSTVTVKSPRNPDAWIIPFWNDVYKNKAACEAALPEVMATVAENADPAVQAESANNCMGVGGVPYKFRIAEMELSVKQWVDFLNTVDPRGRNKHRLWDAAQSSRVWPKYGSVNRNKRAPKGQHYYVASPQWADKPYNVADFTRAARLANALDNGKILSAKTKRKKTVTGKKLAVTTYKVRMSDKT
ncbi:MAG: hypothetical protein GY826_34645, partial [Fuerstiella sp.]|nr:hypothetical protein [Fuerstiella sp.]